MDPTEATAGETEPTADALEAPITDRRRCVGRRADAHRAVVGPAHHRRLRRARRVHQRGQRRVRRLGGRPPGRAPRAQLTPALPGAGGGRRHRRRPLHRDRHAAHRRGVRGVPPRRPRLSRLDPARLHPLPRPHAGSARRLPPRARQGRGVDHPVLRRQQHRRRAHGRAANPPGQAGGAAGDRHRRSPRPGLVAGEGVRGAAARRRRLPAALPAVGDHHLRSRWCCSSTCGTSGTDAADRPA